MDYCLHITCYFDFFNVLNIFPSVLTVLLEVRMVWVQNTLNFTNFTVFFLITFDCFYNWSPRSEKNCNGSFLSDLQSVWLWVSRQSIEKTPPGKLVGKVRLLGSAWFRRTHTDTHGVSSGLWLSVWIHHTNRREAMNSSFPPRLPFFYLLILLTISLHFEHFSFFCSSESVLLLCTILRLCVRYVGQGCVPALQCGRPIPAHTHIYTHSTRAAFSAAKRVIAPWDVKAFRSGRSVSFQETRGKKPAAECWKRSELFSIVVWERAQQTREYRNTDCMGAPPLNTCWKQQERTIKDSFPNVSINYLSQRFINFSKRALNW